MKRAGTRKITIINRKVLEKDATGGIHHENWFAIGDCRACVGRVAVGCGIVDAGGGIGG
jgi:hypothetical protein